MAKAKDASGPTLDHVRNIGIAAHVDAGKTTLTERVLFYTGASHKVGEVHEGTAHMDWMAEEQAHGITITAAVTKCPWKDHLLQVVDTPGHVDFTIEVERSMRVLDGAVIVMDGVRGVEPQTETVWRQANKHAVPRFVFVNKMDRPGADFQRTLDMVKKRFGDDCVAVTLPVPHEQTVLHTILRKAYSFSGEKGEVVTERELTEDEQLEVGAWRETMLLALAEHDEALAEYVLGEQDPPEDLVWSVLRRLNIEGKVRPAFGGSALRNWGVQPMLDAVIKLHPSPIDRPPAKGKKPDGAEVEVQMGPDGPFVGIAFKVQLFEGRRHVFVRIYRGRIEPGMELAVGGRNMKEKIARLFDVDANKRTRIDEASAGQIVLINGLRWATTGDTLCDPANELILERIDAREPVLGLAIEPESSADEEKMLDVLGKITEEDPTLRFEEDTETGQRILKGMGELHLQIQFERVEREFQLKLRAGKPRVVHRETIKKAASAEGGVDRVLDAGGQRIELKADVAVTVKPVERGKGVTVTSQPQWVQGEPGKPPTVNPTQEQMDAVAQGARDSLAGGPVEGSPLEDVAVTVDRVTVFGAASNPQALRIAASQAVREALEKAGGLVLQPIMKIEVVVPDENTGGVLGDLQSRGATILGHEAEGGTTAIDAECGLSALLGYTTDLRSQTRGRGQFVMEFDRFDAL